MQGLSSNRGENNGNNCLKVFVLEAASGSMQYRHPMQVESPANQYNLQQQYTKLGRNTQDYTQQNTRL